MSKHINKFGNDEDDYFGSIVNNLTNNIKDQQQREKMEDYAVMIGSIVAAEAIPVLGELQLGVQFLDFIDPYGYNQALNRDSLNQMLTSQYQSIQDMQASISDCYNSNGSNTQSCTNAGITADDLTRFQNYSPNVQQKLLKTSTSWLTPIDPIVRFPDALMCTTSTNPTQMADCKNPKYQGYYMDYWNKNVAQYQADANAAEQAAAQQAADSLSGDNDQDSRNNNNKRAIQLMLSVAFIVAVLVILLIAKSLTGGK